jgi:hypothetical protein
MAKLVEATIDQTALMTYVTCKETEVAFTVMYHECSQKIINSKITIIIPIIVFVIHNDII